MRHEPSAMQERNESQIGRRSQKNKFPVPLHSPFYITTTALLTCWIDQCCDNARGKATCGCNGPQLLLLAREIQPAKVYMLFDDSDMLRPQLPVTANTSRHIQRSLLQRRTPKRNPLTGRKSWTLSLNLPPRNWSCWVALRCRKLDWEIG